jgi:putative membrane-bound dehydrogenase-like protein
MHKVMKHLPLLLALAMNLRCALAEIPRPTDAPKPLTPEQSAAAFKLPPGFRMEVVASEPLIASPTGVCWDERGRMFVCELHGYNLEGQLDIEELNKTGKLDTQVRRVEADDRFKRAALAGTYGVVKMLRDTNKDGRMDSVDVWATNLPPAYGIVPARGGVIVACAPDIVFLADRDGDGKPEVREVLFTGFRVGEMWRGINSPQWGPDGWIYFGRGWGGGAITGPKLAKPVALPDTDFRIRADGSAIEPVTGATGTFGFAMTEEGDRFTENTTVPAIFIAPLPWRYLSRNPDAAVRSLEAATGDPRAYSISKPHPWRQKRAADPEYFKYYNSRYGAAESEADGWFTAACGPLVYRDSVLPGLNGQYFVCEPSGNLIHRSRIEANGSVLTIHRVPGEEKSEFGATTDQWSHPINLTHGPDGSIWVTDYYREIIEDYSAIPRHLQQQYGVYAGHDRGRIYRLTHAEAPRAPSADMGVLDARALARECASPLLWRRQTAQRLLVERGDREIASTLRRIASAKSAQPSTVITALRTLDQLGVATPGDLRPFIGHADAAVRVHALQIADQWFDKREDRSLLATALTVAAAEQNPRVRIQFALSLGETRDPAAFAILARFARERLSDRWMDAAILSSLHGRGVEMLAALAGDPRGAAPLLAPLAQTVAARRDESELARVLELAAGANPESQAAVLEGLVKGRKNAPRKPLGDKSARAALASLSASSSADVRKFSRDLEESFVAAAADDEGVVAAGTLPPAERVSDETFRKYAAALSGRRDLKRGHEQFLQACAPCHRIGDEGHEVGPDLLGQVGMAEEGLLKDILMPNDRIRPGYETTVVQTAAGGAVTGILKDDGATSLELVLPNGLEQVLLRKDVTGVRRLATSLMPTFAETLSPGDIADVLAWLRSHLGQGSSIPAGSYFELRLYSVTTNKMEAVLERFRDTVEPVRRKHGIKTLGYWTAPSTSNGGTFAYLLSAATKEELEKQERDFGADPEFRKGYAESERRHGRTVDGIVTLPLTADASAKYDFTAGNTMGAFDLRVYSVPPGKLDTFRSRWRDFATPIYERHGLHSVGWWVAEKKVGGGDDQFVCLLGAGSVDAIGKAIAAFHADPEWQRVERETERDGPLRSRVEAFKLKPADVSNIK